MFAENFKVVPILSDLDLNTGATMACDSINMSGFHKALFIVGFQTVAGANIDWAVYSGATDGTCTTIVPAQYALGSATAGSANADVFAAWAEATALKTMAHATDDNKTLLIEVDAAAMGDGHKWLTLRFEDTATGATGNVQVHAILLPRFKSAVNAAASALA